MAVYIYVPAADGFTPMGAYLSANRATPNEYTWYPMAPLAVLPTYADTVLSADGKSILGPAGLVKITAKLTYKNDGSVNQCGARLIVGGTVVQALDPQNTNGAVKDLSWTGTLTDGQAVAVEGASRWGPSMASGATSSWITIEALA
ncbi:hypothetical protein G4X40_16795 [Rhodococcus sp. D2-41]|uniref:hypothetical protein n=1 Tax=Speluncibacter jeojiensis TaxID=2710754 RepID=UPI00241089A7|nr:hypothetical protein [Rhodococcus sp. D2-41]MDG3011805.1 hypothetical protein [Rhodococcus sp. D2-41]